MSDAAGHAVNRIMEARESNPCLAKLPSRQHRSPSSDSILREYNGTAMLRDLSNSNSFEAEEGRELVRTFLYLLVVERLEIGGRPSEIVRTPKT